MLPPLSDTVAMLERIRTARPMLICLVQIPDQTARELAADLAASQDAELASYTLLTRRGVSYLYRSDLVSLQEDSATGMLQIHTTESQMRICELLWDSTPSVETVKAAAAALKATETEEATLIISCLAEENAAVLQTELENAIPLSAHEATQGCYGWGDALQIQSAKALTESAALITLQCFAVE